MRIRLLKDCDVPMANWVKGCDCCGPTREYPDNECWFPKGEEFDPDERYNEIDLAGHTDTFKFGREYEIIQYP